MNGVRGAAAIATNEDAAAIVPDCGQLVREHRRVLPILARKGVVQFAGVILKRRDGEGMRHRPT